MRMSIIRPRGLVSGCHLAAGSVVVFHPGCVAGVACGCVRADEVEEAVVGTEYSTGSCSPGGRMLVGCTPLSSRRVVRVVQRRSLPFVGQSAGSAGYAGMPVCCSMFAMRVSVEI